MKLTESQQTAINTIDRNLQIIACAGSGKTEVITRRIANILKIKKDEKPENIVAFTFTNKAADSMSARINAALSSEGITEDIAGSMYVGTIHGFCLEIIQKFSDKFSNFKLLDSVKKHHFIKRYSDECGLGTLGLTTGIYDLNLFDSCLDKMVYESNNMDLWPEESRKAFLQYKESLYSHGFIDFSLIILEAVNILKTDSEAKKYAQSIHYLVVDEYQDVDDIQEELIELIVSYGANICVVGDDDQTIYQFRGSNANNMITFSKRYEYVVTVKLDTNFRCAKNIIDVANTVISNNENRLPKRMLCPDGCIEGSVTWNRYDTDNEQYVDMAKQIVHLGKEKFESTAVLCRKGKYIKDIIRVFDIYSIPYATNSSDFFFSGVFFNKYVDTLKLLSGLDKPKLYEIWQKFASPENFTIGYKLLRRACSGRSMMSDILHEFLDAISFFDDDNDGNRKTNYIAFEQILNDYDEIYGDQQITARVNGVIKFLSSYAAEEYKYHNFVDEEDSDNCVKIMTVHKSKGLEFESVFIPNLQEGQFPAANRGGKKYWHVLGEYFENNKDKYESDEEDERKLFYVAVTRAKRSLSLMWQSEKKPASVFIIESNESASIDIPPHELTESSTKSKCASKYTTNEVGERVYERFDWRQLKTDLREPFEAALHGPKPLRMGAHADIDRIYNASDEELIEMAKKAGLDINKYKKYVVYHR